MRVVNNVKGYWTIFALIFFALIIVVTSLGVVGECGGDENIKTKEESESSSTGVLKINFSFDGDSALYHAHLIGELDGTDSIAIERDDIKIQDGTVDVEMEVTPGIYDLKLNIENESNEVLLSKTVDGVKISPSAGQEESVGEDNNLSEIEGVDEESKYENSGSDVDGMKFSRAQSRCVDTDGGANKFVAGNVYGSEVQGGSQTYHYDSCDPDSRFLTEYYCTRNKLVRSRSYDCWVNEDVNSGGCINGACVCYEENGYYHVGDTCLKECLSQQNAECREGQACRRLVARGNNRRWGRVQDITATRLSLLERYVRGAINVKGA